jgi:hypothetical protein
MPLAKSALKEAVKKAEQTLTNPPVVGGRVPMEMVERLPDRYYDYLNVKWDGELEIDNKVRDQVHAIWKYAEDRVKDKDDSSVMCYIDRIARKLGLGSHGERRYQKIYHYITLSKMSKSVDKELKMYERK